MTDPQGSSREPSSKDAPPALSRLGKAILRHVTDAAEECLDADENYWDCGPNVAELLKRFEEPPSAIQAELRRLIRDDYIGILIDPKQRWQAGGVLPDEALIFPSLSALRGHPAFQRMPDEELQTAIEKLKRRPR